MPKNKRGQFYLITAVILAGLVLGLLSVYNQSSNTETYSKIPELSQQLNLESEAVLDYDLNNNQNKFDNFASNFSEYSGKDVNIIYIVGKKDHMKAFNYSDGIKKNLPIFSSSGDNLKFEFRGITYSFPIINDGENFHYIISQDYNGGTFITTDEA